MHVVIATDGNLDPDHTAPLAAALAGQGGTVTVLTVVEVPRRLLADLQDVYGSSEILFLDGERVDLKSAERTRPVGWPGDDAVIQRYLAGQRETRTAAMVVALEREGTSASVEVREGENAAVAVLEAIDELGADVVCIGSHRSGVLDGLLGSTGNKIARLATCPVLLIRPRR